MSNDMSNVELHDKFLILRDSELYRSELGRLSTLFATAVAIANFTDAVSKLSSLIEHCGSDNFLEKNFYMKSDLKSTFATLNDVTNLTANETYVFKTTAAQQANMLSTESQLTAWRNDLFVEHQNQIVDGYIYTREAWNSVKDHISKAEEGAQEFIQIEDIPSLESDEDW